MKVKSIFFGNNLLLLYAKIHLNAELLEHLCRNVYSLGFGCLFPDAEGCCGSVRGGLSQAAATWERAKPARSVGKSVRNVPGVRGKVWGMSLGVAVLDSLAASTQQIPTAACGRACAEARAISWGNTAAERNRSPWRAHTGAREELKWTDQSTHSPSLRPCSGAGRGKGVGNRGMKLSLQETGYEGKVLRFYLCFWSSKCNLIIIKLIFPELSLFCLWW